MTRLGSRLSRAAAFVNYGVWERTDDKWYIRPTKIVSLSVRSFFDRDLQTQAYSLTYSTLLAIVPVLAMIFAVARGFGFQNILKTQFFHYFPAQKEALEQAFGFVDNYLNQSSEGVFVGVGIVVLLWTLISLIWNVEDAFNLIWRVKDGRSIWRKITDYTTIFMILPLLMICASGINILMSSTLMEKLPFHFLSPLMSGLLDALSLALTWLFFVGAYVLIPNTRVPIKNAMGAGVLAAIGFMILQWLFVTGTVYVSRYNAIYGSFAFLPLLLVWLQFVWLIVLSGAVVCYSSQSLGMFSFLGKISHISIGYRLKVRLAVMAAIALRFEKEEKPASVLDISNDWGIPMALVDNSVNTLHELSLISRVVIDDKSNKVGYAPAVNPDILTVGLILRKIADTGQSGFIPEFDKKFNSLVRMVDKLEESTIAAADKIPIRDLFPDTNPTQTATEVTPG